MESLFDGGGRKRVDNGYDLTVNRMYLSHGDGTAWKAVKRLLDAVRSA
jgi:hypothetical protein